MEQFKEAFKEEAHELLNKLESTLLELEQNPSDNDALLSLFRTMHTIKGSAAMFGFDHTSSFAHTLENCLDDVKGGRVPFTADLADLTLKARDHIYSLLEFNGDPDDAAVARSKQIESDFVQAADALRPVREAAPDQSASAEGSSADTRVRSGYEQATMRTYRIEFRPQPDIYKDGTNPLLLLNELAGLGLFGAVPHLDRIPPLSEMNPEVCSVSWTMFLTTEQPQSAVEDVFMFVEDSAKVVIEEIENLEEATESNDAGYKRVGQILAERGIIDAMQAERAAAGQVRIGERLVEQGVPQSEVDAALLEQQHVRKSRERFQSELSSSTIRVDSEKLDGLVDLVGELVTLQARLTSSAQKSNEPDVVTIAEGLERLVDELRDRTMTIRMVPVGSTFSKFRRLVRDLSESLGKKVNLATEGGETELDKTVIERLNEPLVHIVRNAVDHGIESPGQRKNTGKDETGTVLLRASHQGANVVIDVVDDGKGLDGEKLREKARERGIQVDEVDENDIYRVIFASGFSTADSVSEVSGRGVGMDVVRRQVEALGGSVRIDSTPGSGTTISLLIPLTLAIIDGLLVRVANGHYVFPLSSVSECIEFTRSEVDASKGQYIRNRGHLLPFAYMRDVFGLGGTRPEHEQMVVVHGQNGDIGFIVDTVLGDHQTVIKDLGRLFRHIDGVSGATILGDGSVALVCDIARLQRVVHTEYGSGRSPRRNGPDDDRVNN
ncbi:MAG: chemotaxis protein CheA [Spirochaetales bacterium]